MREAFPSHPVTLCFTLLIGHSEGFSLFTSLLFVSPQAEGPSLSGLSHTLVICHMLAGSLAEVLRNLWVNG